jgi:hypothetical protein
MVDTPRWNTERLVQISLAGEVAPSSLPGRLGASSFIVAHDGRAHLVPPWAGVTRNVKVGDPATGWAGERVEPGASIRHRDHGANQALLFYACIGNEARVMSGVGAGASGVVTGKHGRFAETVIVRFSDEALGKLATGDRVVVHGWGTGLQCEQCPSVRFKSLDPRIATALVTVPSAGTAAIRVRGIVPPGLAGAGLGLSADAGSLAIQTADTRAIQRAGLDGLRLGDLVAFQDIDAEWTICYRRGAWTIGVISAADSVQAGYGIVTTVVATARAGLINPVVALQASVVPHIDRKPG